MTYIKKNLGQGLCALLGTEPQSSRNLHGTGLQRPCHPAIPAGVEAGLGAHGRDTQDQLTRRERVKGQRTMAHARTFLSEITAFVVREHCIV